MVIIDIIFCKIKQCFGGVLNEDTLLPVFAEGKIDVYPYQVAAALFAVRNPYQKGVILCDEACMGKSHSNVYYFSKLV